MGNPPKGKGGKTHRADSATIAVADFVAECSIECGISFRNAREHSLPELKLLRQAARRLRADSVLAGMNASYAAFAAVMSKDGNRVFKKMADNIKKAAGL